MTTSAAPEHETSEYERWRREFHLEVPERFNYTVDVVDDWARREPDKPALVAVAADGTVRRLTFGEISDSAARAAAVFRAAGLGKGDTVLVQLPRVAEWYPVMLGLFRIGAVPMPGTTQLTGKDMQYRIEASDAAAVVVGPDGAEKFETVARDCPTVRARFVVGTERDGAENDGAENDGAENDGAENDGWRSFEAAVAAAEPDAVPEPTRSDDGLLIYFTSGTTGFAKMVLHTHASLGIGHEITARYWHGLGEGDLHWTVSDFGWAKAAWGKLFGQWRLGAAIFLWDIVGSPDYDRMLRMIGEHGITSFCAPPTIYRAFVQMDLTQYDWSSLRHCTAAGEPLNPEVIAVWKRATGIDIHDGFGQTETVCAVANFKGMRIKAGSMGKPAPGFDVQVVDDEGKVVGDHEEGNIAIATDPRPIGLFKEYWRAPERNEAAFRHGWYYTGDRAYRDEDGYIWFVGRSDDVILSAGYRIGPFEVESALVSHPAVVESAVVGKPDEARGEIVKAFVVLAAGVAGTEALVQELQDHVKATTAPYKYPREIEFTEALPKTISGKIRRVELRERAR